MWSKNVNQPPGSIININDEISKIKGSFTDKQAKILLAKFLRQNIGFTTELISGIKLAPYQEIAIKGFMNSNFSMLVWGRGISKSFSASVFCFLQCIFEPNTKILIAGPTFRTARSIFNNIEKFADSKGAEMLAQAFGHKTKRNDEYDWQINGGSIKAIPLGGDKIRGFRANVLVLDEFLLLPEDLVKNVLMPFLVAPQNIKERMEVREIEDNLILEGLLKEEDRMVFPNNAKMVALSSASYTFENLYKTYQEWSLKAISNKKSDSKYFVMQMSYEAAPPEMIDHMIIEEAKNGGASHSAFMREYCAQFTDGSDSYFSAKKMHECTVPDGNDPTTLIRGKKGEKYILAIDPSFSDSPTSDYFAMAVVALDEEDGSCTLVHNYAVAGGNIKEHIKYLYYLVSHFDIEMIIIDNAGYQFLDSANESEWFRNSNTELKFFEFDSDREGIDYEMEIKKVKRFYNKQDNVKCFKQNFTSSFIRKANEHLKASIDYKRIFFASKATANGSAFDRICSERVPIEMTQYESVLDLIEAQDGLIYQVKKQCSLIEVKSTAKGTQTFDLPQHLKRSSSANRARRDNYTTLMLSAWAAKCYFDMMRQTEEDNFTFVPRMI